jgi:hypothetical protein
MRSRSLISPWLIAAIAALALGGCGKTDHDVKASDQAQPPQASTSSTPPSTPPPSQMAQADSAVDANASETAKGSDAPMKSMSKDEESKAMPQPGQANDHSTVAQDPKEQQDSK